MWYYDLHQFKLYEFLCFDIVNQSIKPDKRKGKPQTNL